MTRCFSGDDNDLSVGLITVYKMGGVGKIKQKINSSSCGRSCFCLEEKTFVTQLVFVKMVHTSDLSLYTEQWVSYHLSTVSVLQREKLTKQMGVTVTVTATA